MDSMFAAITGFSIMQNHGVQQKFSFNKNLKKLYHFNTQELGM